MPFRFRQDRRDEIRVRYPTSGDRPQLVLPFGECTLLDLGEHSLKFLSTKSQSIAMGQHLAARIEWESGRALMVEGVVLRKDSDDGIVLTLTQPVPAELLREGGRDRRSFFRLRYPLTERPQMESLYQQFETCEISERGIRFLNSLDNGFVAGQAIHATLTFRDGHQLPIEGRVLRLDKNEVVVMLSTGIPEARVMAEQRFLIQRYRQML
jgi:hypothetical protein